MKSAITSDSLYLFFTFFEPRGFSKSHVTLQVEIFSDMFQYSGSISNRLKELPTFYIIHQELCVYSDIHVRLVLQTNDVSNS